MTCPKITVITACLNAARTIETTIRSVLDQNYPNLEYIIIDGVSTDGTLDIIDKYRDKITKIVSEPDKGIYDAFNKGVALATGDLISILNADDFYAPWTFRLVSQAYRKHPEAGVFYGNLCFFSDVHKFCWYPSYTPFLNDELKKHMILGHPTFFVNKTTYQRYPTFDLKYKIAADWDWALQFYVDGGEFYRIDGVLAFFRWGGASDKIISLTMEETTIIKKYAQYSQLKTWFIACERIFGRLLMRILDKIHLFEIYLKYLSLHYNSSVLVERMDSCEYWPVMKTYLSEKVR